MPAPDKILELVERFQANRDDYMSSPYNEAQVRREFIDPFFGELGWDMYNDKNHAEQYKDVIHEDSIKIGNNPEAPDYCFRIGGTRKFFLEAKKPSINIREDAHPAYQLRRYAWSAKLPLSILTDFEEFAWYDCRVKPVKTDGTAIARLKYYTFDQYPDAWDEIAGIFSREAILRGSFDRYAATTKGKRGTAEVDKAFLMEIESWRDELARNIALRNPSLSRRDLNFAVQRTIDRIIFLRICEDRSIEEYQTLMALLNGVNVYARLRQMFYKADQRYNSGLFHFNREKDEKEPPDELTPALVIDDKPLKTIIRRLYYPDSPYEFSVLPADILGQVYEQFLGKVIRLTPGHHAKVEDKPEVKKAGGVFYTPTYIVEYIVEHTVGRLLEGKTPKQAAKLRILDPACGSGSFLIVAYQRLLDWHREWYTAHDPEKWCRGREPRLVRMSERDWRLTTSERKRILLNNIYGVDIDTQAVEVTKLSLLLKVLEGETGQSIDNQTRLFHERVLPDLVANIKCGNSLIGTDFYDGAQLDLFDEEERYRINVFDWEDEFPEIFRAGGFDAVVGNPPYVLLQSLFSPDVERYFKNVYISAAYKIDTYHIFIEKACLITKHNGLISYITSNTFLNNKYSYLLRKFLLSNCEILCISLYDYTVFPQASVDTSVFVLRKSNSPNRNNKVTFYKSVSENTYQHIGDIKQNIWYNDEDLRFSIPHSTIYQYLFKKIKSNSTSLGLYANAYFGIQTHGRDIYVKRNKINDNWKPIIDGANIGRYTLHPPSEYVLTKPEAIKSGGKIEVYESNRIGVRQIGKVPIATIIPKGIYALNTIYNIYLYNDVQLYIEFILGIISSKLINWYWSNVYFDQKKTFPKIKKNSLLSIPIRTIDFSSPDDVARHDRMVSLVTAMLDLHKQLAAAGTAHDKTAIRRLIDATDREIDRLVYELYGLTDEEIGIVEGGQAGG